MRRRKEQAPKTCGVRLICYGKHRNQQAPWLINITILRSSKDVSNTTFHTTSTLLIIDYSLLADTTLTLDTTKYYKLQRTHYLLIQL
ncbi:hypothetical protein PVAP13_8KG057240 [Panicum virgatum]|uniref:Uncharacterized protein n=1 Tax=Panicum virgatum TaxID=38727 RepID=A0A8T0PMM6_PANVG|nr:hypothetical protein PVAP13_8KG057240 [Panicum virgatum]